MNAFGMVWQWLRPYQRDIITDTNRYVAVNKSRRVGISDAIGLRAVLIASGLFEQLAAALGIDPVAANNVNIVSKDELAAKEVIKYAKKWVGLLRNEEAFRPFLLTGTEWSKSAIDFEGSGYEIRAHTQSENAARSATGHLVLDEAAHYREHEGIERGAVPSINSTPDLTLMRVSTPNGTSGRGELFYRICEFPEDWPQYSRHRITIYDAVAQGMPVDIDEIRAQCPTEDVFQQEYNCSFLGAGQNYYSAKLLRSAHRHAKGEGDTYMGIDVASVVDRTGVTIWRVDERGPYVWHRYLISGVPYASQAGTHGQDAILSALIGHHRPSKTCIDVTGDTATIMAGLHARNLPTAFVPLHIKREWKTKWVPAFKGALERGQVHIAENARTFSYDRHKARQGIEVETCFGALVRDPLLRDFERVHKRLTPGGATTFDTTRDTEGHGDLFWSTLLGWYAVVGGGSSRVSKPRIHHIGARQWDIGGW